MVIFKVSVTHLIWLLYVGAQTLAELSACELKERRLAALDLAKESISKAKDLQSACGKNSKDISSNSSECCAKEKVSAYLDIARNLIDNAKENYSTCDETITKVVFINKKPMDCSEILENGERNSGVYEIWPRSRISDGKPLLVYCDMDTDGGGWTVIQRGNFSNKENLYLNWKDNKHGFGNLTHFFSLGNDNLFALTNQKNYTLRFEFENEKKDNWFYTFRSFWMESEAQNYTVHYDYDYESAGNEISPVKSMQFSAQDKEKEKYSLICATARLNGWRYEKCGHSNPAFDKNDQKYMSWDPYTDNDSLITVESKLR